VTPALQFDRAAPLSFNEIKRSIVSTTLLYRLRACRIGTQESLGVRADFPPVLDKKIAHAAVGYFFDSGGEDGNRTGLNGFTGRFDGLEIKHLNENLSQRLPRSK
jgi:hypothetical protein